MLGLGSLEASVVDIQAPFRIEEFYSGTNSLGPEQ